MTTLNTYGGITHTKWDIEINTKSTDESLKPTIINAMFEIAEKMTTQRPITLDIQWENGDRECQTR